MKLKKYLLILILAINTGILYPQSPEQCLISADSFYLKQNFEQAANLYRRIIFFDTFNDLPLLYYKLAECLFFSNNYSEALFYYQIAYQNTENKSFANDILFRKAMIFLLKSEFQESIRELLSIDTSLNDETVRRYYFYHAIIAYRSEKYDSSRQLFIKSLNVLSDSTEINRIFSKSEINGKPNPNTAKLLSMLLPGLGQLYAGDIKNAVNSFLLNSILAGVFIYVSQKYGLVDAGLSVFPWFQRYYFGGFNRAKQIALARQEIKKEKLLSEIMSFFEQKKNNLHN